MRDIEELSDEERHLEERRTKVKDSKERSLTTEERDEIIRKYNAEHSIHHITPDVVDRPEDDDIAERTLSEHERADLLQEIHDELLSGGECDELVKECADKADSKSDSSELVDITDTTSSRYHFVLDRNSSCLSYGPVIDTTRRCMEYFMKNPNNSHDENQKNLDYSQKDLMNRHLKIINILPEQEVRNILKLEENQSLSDNVYNKSEKLLMAVLPEVLEQYVQLLLGEDPIVSGSETLSFNLLAIGSNDNEIDVQYHFSDCHSHVLDIARIRALSVVTKKGRSRLSNAEYSSARGYGSPSVPLDIFLMMIQGFQEPDGLKAQELIDSMSTLGIHKPSQIQRYLRALQTVSLQRGIQLAYRERRRLVSSPAFYTDGGKVKPVTSLMRTGMQSDPDEIMYHIGTGETRYRSDITIRNVDYERKLKLRTEIGIQEETAYLSNNPDVKELYVFSIDGASNPVVIGGGKSGLVTLPRGKAWGHSTTISAVSDLAGITTILGTQDTRNDWISTIKVAVGRREDRKWKWKTGRIKDDVIKELTMSFMTTGNLSSAMRGYDAKRARRNPIKGLLLRMVGGSQLFESGNVGVKTKRDISPRSIDCLFLADILAGNTPELVTLQPDSLRQQRIGKIANDKARCLLFNMDKVETSPYSLTIPSILDDPLMYVYGILGGKLLHSLQGSVVETKPLIRYQTKGFSKLQIGTESEQMSERLRLSQQEVLFQEADLDTLNDGPNQLEKACIVLSALKISDEIRRHIDESESIFEVAIRVASTLVSHKIGEGIRNGHTKIRSSILAKSSDKYDIFKVVFTDIVPPERFSIERYIRNVQLFPFLNGVKRNLFFVEDLLANGSTVRLMLDNGSNIGPIFIPINIEDYTCFKKGDENLSVSSTWESRGSANLLFMFKPIEVLRDIITNQETWFRIENSFTTIEYISKMMLTRTKKIESKGKLNFEIIWDQEFTKYEIPENLDYNDSLLLCAYHYNNILTQLDKSLIETNHTIWDIIDSNKLVPFIIEILLCTKSAVVTDPMGKQGRLHLDSNGMSRETSDVLSEVATEKFLPMIETLSMGWLQKSVISGFEGHSEGIIADVRPGPGMDGTMLLYNPTRNISETWITLESKTYNMLSIAKGQNPAKARDNLVKGLLHQSEKKMVLARLSFGAESVVITLPSQVTDTLSSNEIRDEFITKESATIDELLARLQGVAISSRNYDIAEKLSRQRGDIDTLGERPAGIAPNNVEMGVLLSLAYNKHLHLFEAFPPLQTMSLNEINQSFSQKTISLFKLLGWIDYPPKSDQILET